MSTHCPTIKAGVNVELKSGLRGGCCGTGLLAWSGTVREYLEDSHGKIIVVMEDGTLAWADDLQVKL